MFKIDTHNIRQLERDLKTFALKAFPFATRKTLNDAAFQAQRIARVDVKERMILRNQFTTRSIQVRQTKTLQVSRQKAAVGSTANYMEDQEFGAVKSKPANKEWLFQRLILLARAKMLTHGLGCLKKPTACRLYD